MPEANEPKPDTQTPDDQTPAAAKPDAVRAESGLARALDQIKSAEEDLARLDRLVSGMERGGDVPRISQAGAGAEAAKTPEMNTPETKISQDKPSGHKAATGNAAPQAGTNRNQGLKGDRPMLRALAVLVLAIGLLGAAVASQYRDEARSIGRSIMTQLARPAAKEPAQASAVQAKAQQPTVQLAAADGPTAVPVAPVAKEAENAAYSDTARPEAAKAGAVAPDPSSSDLAQSLKAITTELASINAKLEQAKSRNEQALREQADTIQQLRTAQEKNAADNARLAAQVQALQTQLSTSSTSAAAKPVVRSVPSNDNAAPARPHLQAAAPRRPRPSPRGPWMPPPYMMDPYDPDW